MFNYAFNSIQFIPYIYTPFFLLLVKWCCVTGVGMDNGVSFVGLDPDDNTVLTKRVNNHSIQFVFCYRFLLLLR